MEYRDQVELFKACRRALKMSERDLQVELCLQDARSVHLMETGQNKIAGLAWVAMMYLLDENDLVKLADQVHVLVESLRDKIEARLARKWQAWQEKKAIRFGDSEE